MLARFYIAAAVEIARLAQGSSIMHGFSGLRLSGVMAVLALVGACQAPHGGQHGGVAATVPSRAVDMQGDPRAFIDNANGRAFYDLTVRTLKPGAAPVDVAAYEAEAFAIFRAMGASMGVMPDAMQDHLKAIPRQMIGIVQDDPKVLDSFDNFSDALVGPR